MNLHPTFRYLERLPSLQAVTPRGRLLAERLGLTTLSTKDKEALAQSLLQDAQDERGESK